MHFPEGHYELRYYKGGKTVPEKQMQSKFLSQNNISYKEAPPLP